MLEMNHSEPKDRGRVSESIVLTYGTALESFMYLVFQKMEIWWKVDILW